MTEKKYFHIYSTDKSEFYFNSFYAVDEKGWAGRFVEIKEDGVIGLANDLVQIGDTFLPEASIYPVSEASGSGFEVKEITKDVFDAQWVGAVEYARKNKLKPLLTGVIY